MIKIKIEAGYLVHQASENAYFLCKILKEYDKKEEAQKDLLDLLTNETSEKKLMKEYFKERSIK